MTPKVEEQFERANAEQRARCIKLMNRFVEVGPQAFDEKKFKKQRSFPTGGRGGERCSIFAFKAHQLRVYGGYVPGKAGEFVCTEIEVAKKRDRADSEKLRRSARLLGEFSPKRKDGR